MAKERLKMHLQSARHPDRTCCGWQTRGRVAQLVAALESVPIERRCQLCAKRSRFARRTEGAV
jgi:hypothetical protein